MSRSFHQRHKRYRNKKCPRTFLECYLDANGYKKFIERKRKIRPYGMKCFIGYGEEEYSKIFGEFFETKVNKKKERFLSKKNIINESDEVMGDRERDKMIIESLRENDKMYILNANGFDYDVFEITVIGDVNVNNYTFLGEEFGKPKHRPETYDIRFLYTAEELYSIYKIRIY